MRRTTSPPLLDDLARRRLDALIAELGGGAEDPPLAETAGGTPSSVWDDLPAHGRHARPRLPLWARAAGWVDDRLPDALRGRVQLTRTQVGVLALLLACGVGWAAWGTLRTGHDVPVARPVASPASMPAAGTPAAAPSGSGATAASGAAPLATGTQEKPAELVVDVQGDVRRPGIVVLPVGSRVVDAVDEAGGYTGRPRALTAVNLARPLVDGEQVVVGRAATRAATGAATGAAGSPGAGGAGRGRTGQPQHRRPGCLGDPARRRAGHRDRDPAVA